MDAEIIVRPLATDEEIDAFCYLAIEAFSGADGDFAEMARRWRRSLEAMPEFHPRQRRGAFRGDTFVGGYMMYERTMRVGAARLPTGCIGAVVTHPNHRMRGVGTFLMRDAIAFAERHGHVQLLLDGIPGFYYRWGYADVYDLTEQIIDRAALTSDLPADCSTRPATMADAPALLALYERYYGPYTGSFTRTIEQQHTRLARWLDQGNPPVLAVDARDHALGYLLLPRTGDRAHAGEVAASTWPAAAALLRYHSRLVDTTPDAPTSLSWPLPPDSLTYFLLADHLSVPGVPPDDPNRKWAVRGETYAHRHAAWMARPVSLRRIAEALLPAWQTRLATSRVDAAGPFTIRMGDEACAFEVAGSVVRLLDSPELEESAVVLSPQQLIQLVYGYRPARYLAAQSGARVPEALVPLLDALFPAGQPWIPWSDGF